MAPTPIARRFKRWSRRRRPSFNIPTGSPTSAASHPTTGCTTRRCSIAPATPNPDRPLLRLPDQPAALSAIQAFFRERQPPTLIVWGKNDKIFPADGAHPYKRDLPDVEFHLIDTGHFALEDKADEMVPLIRDFLDRKVAPN